MHSRYNVFCLQCLGAPVGGDGGVNVNDLFAKLVTAGIIRRKSTEKITPVSENTETHEALTDVPSGQGKETLSGRDMFAMGHILEQLKAEPQSQDTSQVRTGIN